MANKKEPSLKKHEKESHPKKSSEGGLSRAATAIGSALGAIGAKMGIEKVRPADLKADSQAKESSTGKRKPAKQIKSKLPRRPKKADP